MTAAVLGTLAFIFGLGVSICSWVLSAKVSTFYISSSGTSDIRFKNYWWGGLTYIVPGILGIIAGCTRNVTAMVFYMIFNLLCLLSSIVVTIFVGLLIVAWAVIETIIQSGQCIDSGYSYAKQCTCTDYDGETYVINNMTCSDVTSIQSILTAIIALASISSLIAFVSSYVSCCALCNQESDAPAVIIQSGAGQYQPPQNIVISNNSSQQFMQQPQYPAGYAQPTGYQPPPYANQAAPYNNPNNMHSSKANLVKSEVI